MRGVLNSLLVASVAAILGVGCSFGDATVGAPQTACGAMNEGSSQASQGTSYYPVGSRQTPAAATCEGNTGSACDDCEGAHCCPTRSACYGDPVCACADLSFDECLDDAATQPVAVAAERTSQCWSTFSAAGTVEQARIACQRSWCPTECEVP